MSKVTKKRKSSIAHGSPGYTSYEAQGKFGFLEVLDAQRGLFEAKAALLDTQNGYQRAVIDIQRLTGTDMQKLTNEKAKE